MEVATYKISVVDAEPRYQCPMHWCLMGQPIEVEDAATFDPLVGGSMQCVYLGWIYQEPGFRIIINLWGQERKPGTATQGLVSDGVYSAYM